MCNIPCVTLLACVRETSTEDVTKTNLEPEVLRLTPSDPPSQGTTAAGEQFRFLYFFVVTRASPAQPSPAQSGGVTAGLHPSDSGQWQRSPVTSQPPPTHLRWVEGSTDHTARGSGAHKIRTRSQALNRSASVSVSRRRHWQHPSEHDSRQQRAVIRTLRA